jgi:GDP-L-fucose synthase
MDWNKKKILVLGGGGFLGTRIARKAEEKGADVSVPRTSDGIDFRREKDCIKVMNEVNPQIVINCAAQIGGIGYHDGKQADLFLDNVKMGLFLMDAAQKSGVKKFVNIIAGCAYPGYLEKDELNEEDYWEGEVHDSIFSYGVARKISGVFGKAQFKQYKFNSIHLLLANMYGPREHFHPERSKALAGLIKKFYDAKKSGAPTVTVWGTGNPIRDWLYVDDGADGILRATEVYNNIDPLNIASGVGISVADLAKLIKEIIGYEGEIVFDTTKKDGAPKKIFGVIKMKKELNWMPSTNLKDGIRETVDWLDKNYETAVLN